MSESNKHIYELFRKKEFSVLGVGTHKKGNFCWDISRAIAKRFPEWGDEYDAKVKRNDHKIKLSVISSVRRFISVAGIPIREKCGRGTLDLNMLADSLREFDDLLMEFKGQVKNIRGWPKGSFENVLLVPFYSSTIKHEDTKVVTEAVLGKSPINYVYGNIDNLVIHLIGGMFVGKHYLSREILENTSYGRAMIMANSWELLSKFKNKPSKWTDIRNRKRHRSISETIKKIKENL